jgi:16S rRNA (guanine966-N2)-methyltransferase
MRITGGQARGRKIGSPTGCAVRPTASKVRQALFNMIGRKIENARFLDICAGSGLIGLEALSRGAASLTSIEENRAFAQALQATASKLAYDIKVLPLDFRKALILLRGEKFDLIFADPPYKSGCAQKILDEILKHELLDEEGLVIIEHLSDLSIEAPGQILAKTKTRTYGQTALSFFQSESSLKRSSEPQQQSSRGAEGAAL